MLGEHAEVEKAMVGIYWGSRGQEKNFRPSTSLECRHKRKFKKRGGLKSWQNKKEREVRYLDDSSG